MGAIVDALHRLQQLERKLNDYRSKEEAFRRQARAVRRQIEKGLAECKAHQAEIIRCQMDIDSVDLDIKSREDALIKHRQALNAAKTNKEYAAILTVLNTEKADTSKCESRILELMARKEELLAKSNEFREQQERLEARLAKQEHELAAFLERTRADVQQLEAERDEAAAALPPSALDSFNRVSAKLDGEAMAEVVRLNSRGEEHLCDGCNMSVPLETVNRLRSRDELVLCGACGRILYVDPAKVNV